MTPHTFWTIFLKIFGLYLIWQILVILPSFFSSLVYAKNEDWGSLLTTCSAIVLIVCFFILIVRNCLFKTDWVIKKLNLEKGITDEKLEINIHRSSLLTIVITVIGGLMIADGLPLLAYNAFEYVKYINNYKGLSDNRATPYLVSNLLKVIIGYFMVADTRLIVNFIDGRRKKTVANIGDINE